MPRRDRNTGGVLAVLGLMAGLMFAQAANADGSYYRKYEVTITNITRGQTFTPILVATHSARVGLFELGAPAGEALEILAEDGSTTALTEALLEAGYEVADVETIPGLLAPGATTSVIVEATRFQRFLSLAAMLIPTNDTFVALDTVPLPFRSRSYTAIAYDAGTEANDQNCLNMPGPRCGGEGFSPGPNEGDEGYVYVSNGFHELPPAAQGEVLGPLVYDWRNPVARVVVRRIR